jgi:hypothetical protein
MINPALTRRGEGLGDAESSARLVEQIAKVDHCLVTYVKQTFVRSVEFGDKKDNRREGENKNRQDWRSPETGQSPVVAGTRHGETRHEVERNRDETRNPASQGCLNPFRVQIYDLVQRFDEQASESGDRFVLYRRDRLRPETGMPTLGGGKFHLSGLGSFQSRFDIPVQNISDRRALGFGQEGGAQVSLF